MEDERQTAYAILRDGRAWMGVTTQKLEQQPDGAFSLPRLPGLPPQRAITLAGPYESEPSGVAVGECGDLYIAGTLHDRLVFREGSCGTEKRLPGRPGPAEAPGHFRRPRGLLLQGKDTLYAADSGSGRIQVLHLPGMEVRALWENGLVKPAGMAIDGSGRIYVLGLEGTVGRFYPDGTPDPEFQAALAADPELVRPTFLAVDHAGIIYLSEAASNRVLRYDESGSPLGALPAAAEESPARPRCLLAQQDRLYIADSARGQIWVYDTASGLFLGTVPGYRGPVAAMAAGPDGSLYVKPGPDESVHRLEAEAGCAAAGSLQAGPLDAGTGDTWRRVLVDVETPPGARVFIEQFASADLTSPGEGDWSPAASADWLVSSPGRYLWLRLRLESENQNACPRLLQIQAETSGEDYMDYLPAVYRRRDAETGFLRRWLNLFRSELAGLEQELEDMHLRFNPQRTPEDHLPWLAGWLGFRLPARMDALEWRELLPNVQHLYQRRGTVQGVADFVELYCGVRPVILEDYRQRHLWVLGRDSGLGMDTGLAPLLPDGMLLPDRGDQDGRGWSDPAGLVVGEVVVGQSAPQSAAEHGQGLFSETAHRFTVLIPAAALPQPEQRELLLEMLEAEKPAHTDFHLCFVEARLSVGKQFRLGIDAIVAGPPDPMALGTAGLGRGSGLQAGDAAASRLGSPTAPAGEIVLY